MTIKMSEAPRPAETRAPIHHRVVRFGRELLDQTARIARNEPSPELAARRLARERITAYQRRAEELPTLAAQLVQDFNLLLAARRFDVPDTANAELVPTSHVGTDGPWDFESRQRVRLVGPTVPLASETDLLLGIPYNGLGESPFVSVGELQEIAMARFTAFDGGRAEAHDDYFHIMVRTSLPSQSPNQPDPYIEHSILIYPGGEQDGAADSLTAEFTYFGADSEDRPTLQVDLLPHEVDALMQTISGAARHLATR